MNHLLIATASSAGLIQAQTILVALEGMQAFVAESWAPFAKPLELSRHRSKCQWTFLTLPISQKKNAPSFLGCLAEKYHLIVPPKFQNRPALLNFVLAGPTPWSHQAARSDCDSEQVVCGELSHRVSHYTLMSMSMTCCSTNTRSTGRIPKMHMTILVEVSVGPMTFMFATRNLYWAILQERAITQKGPPSRRRNQSYSEKPTLQNRFTVAMIEWASSCTLCWNWFSGTPSNS